MKLYLFIINPKSGSGKGQRVWDLMKTRLDKEKVKYRSFFTTHPGHATDIAQQVVELHHDKIGAIIAVGGDGTMNEVVNGLLHYPNLRVGHIAAGSGNDFARGLKLPRKPLKALDQLVIHSRPNLQPIDIGKCSFPSRKWEKPRSFINGVGIGFDGDIAKNTNKTKYKPFLNKLKLGSLAYIITAIRMIFTYETHQLTIQVDGRKHTFDDVWMVSVCNNPYMGGGLKVTPNAKMNDGLLDLCVVHKFNRFKLLAIMGTAFLGKHTRFKGITILRGRTIQVESTNPVTVHADGEVIGTTPIEVQVDAGSRMVYT
jgi:YegS/Rv2252/BmrU family lipid kinase